MNNKRLAKIYRGIFAVFLSLLVLFFFLAGEQLKYRDGQNVINVTEATGSTVELTPGVTVEQLFISDIDRLKSVSFLCTTHYRDNTGYLNVVLKCGEEVLIEEIVSVADIKENVPVIAEADEYLEGYRGKQLTLLISGTSKEGKAVSVLLNSASTAGVSLYVGQHKPGSICFSTTGQDFVFTGQHYWQMVAGLSAALALGLYVSYKHYEKTGKDYAVSVILAMERYEFLISQLVSRDFKTKYKRSVLGVFWSFLNPLLTMTVQYIVFSTLFRNDIANYPVYLLTGIICFSFFNEVTNMCLSSITGNANLVKKVYMPRYIFPISRTISSSINLAISLIPLLLVSLITGVALRKSLVLMLFFLICLIIFSLGVGMFLSATMVFFRDIQFLWSVVVMMWQYGTPIFYSPSIIPPRFSFILKFNPIYHFIKNVRMCLIDGISPEPRAYAICFAFALLSLLIGSVVFKKTQDSFTLYL